MSGKKIITIICIFLFCVLAVFFIKKSYKKKPEYQIPPRPVQVGVAVQKDVPVYIDSFGHMDAFYDVNIVSQVTGQIKEVHFEEGNEVSEGDLLFTIDPKEYKAELDKANAVQRGDSVDLKLKKDTLERNRGLVEKNLISKQEFETYQTDKAAGEAAVQLDNANIELAEIDLEYCYIRSPIDGITGKRAVDPGNIVIANSGPTLVNIKTVDPLYLDFTIPERSFPSIHEQMSKDKLNVSIIPAGDDKGPYDGELQFVDNTVDNTTGTIMLRATVPNEEKRLWPGQYVTVRLVVYTEKDAVLVPAESIQLGQNGKFLYVIKEDNTVELRDNLTVGQVQGDLLVIKKGVKAGEKVVKSGQMGLHDGSKVQILPEEDQNSQTTPQANNVTKQK